MLKIILVLLSVISCVEITLANDFRTLDFGDECENIDKLELEMGSQQIIKDKSYQGSFEYQGLEIADKAFISYRCNKEGIFLEGTVSIVTDPSLEAEEKFNEVHELLKNIHGPSIEIISTDIKEQYPEFGSVKEWKSSGYQIRLHGISNLVSIVFSRD